MSVLPPPSPARHRTVLLLVLLLGSLVLAAGLGITLSRADNPPGATAAAGDRPALTVTLTQATTTDWPQTISAHGNIAAWQEVVIGTEVGGQRIAEVLVSIGDSVRQGQLLARIASDNLTAELDQARAAVAEAEAASADAESNAERARRLRDQGFYSPQLASQFQTTAQTARARLAAARAKRSADELRLAQARILAPDHGVISARAATVGTLAQPGQELFRLLRGNRLEWRAELTMAEIGRIRPGMPVSLTLPGGTGQRLTGQTRAVAPTVDTQTRSGLVFVDLPTPSAARAGMYARGEFDTGAQPALHLPQTAVLMRDGFSYVFRINADRRVAVSKVGTGRRLGDRIEIISGLDAATPVVASGVGFLADGDLVRVAPAGNPPQ